MNTIKNKKECINKKSKFFSTIVLIVLLASFILPFASTDGFGRASAAGAPRFVDEMNLLSSSQSAALTKRLDEVSKKHDFDVVVVVVHSLGGKDARVFTADYYEEHGYGLGPDNAGIILLLAMQYRDFAFVTPEGYGTYAFTDAGQEYMERLFLPDLKNNNFYGAFMTFADAADDFLVRAEAGRPYNTGNIPRFTPAERRTARTRTIFGSVIFGLVISLIVTGIWTAQLKSIRKQNFAQSYIRQGSMNLRVQRDVFLHKNVVKTRRAKESSSSGGGSGSFKSSSGGNFSGRSGKF